MSDPLTPLRRTGGSAAPPLDAIKSRAARIERRRHIALGSGAGIIAVVGLVTLFAGAGPNLTGEVPRLAQGDDYVPTPEIFLHTAAPTAEGEGSSAEKRLAQPAVPAAALVPSTQADAEADQTGASESGDRAAAPAQAKSGGDIDVDLDVNEESLGPARRIGFTLTACNTTEEPVERPFPTGQRYDFEVTRDGQFVWRWSDGRAFTQVYGSERWEPGECKTYTDYWNGRYPDGSRAESGFYEAVGTLTSDPPLKADTETFCLDTC